MSRLASLPSFPSPPQAETTKSKFLLHADNFEIKYTDQDKQTLHHCSLSELLEGLFWLQQPCEYNRYRNSMSYNSKLDLQIKHRRLVRSDRAVPPPYQQLVAQRADMYRQLQQLQSQVPSKPQAILRTAQNHKPYCIELKGTESALSRTSVLHDILAIQQFGSEMLCNIDMHLPYTLLQGNTVWKMEVPEELLSPRSRLAANAARRMAQGLSRGVQNLGTILGDFGSFLAGTALHSCFTIMHVLVVTP